MKTLGELHAIGFLIDHFIVGFTLLLLFFLQSIHTVLIVFIIFLIHIIASSVSLQHIRHEMRFGVWGDLGLSISPLLGAAVALLLSSSEFALYVLFACIIGALLFLVIRDILPPRRKGRPAFFVIGLAVTLAILLLI